MKLLRLTTMWALLMAAAQMSAQNRYIYAEPVDVEAGQEAEIVVKMDFDTDEIISGCSFRLTLPEGVELVDTSSPKASCTFPPDLFRDDVSYNSAIIVRKDNDGSYLFVFVDTDYESPMKSTHCELVRISIRSDVSQTVEPSITKVSIVNDKSVCIVIDGKLVGEKDKNALYVDDAEALVGTDVTLSVKMRNEVDIEGFGFDLVLPGGMSVLKDDEGRPMVSLSEERTTTARTNTFEARLMNNAYNDVLRVVAASSNGSAIAAGDGEVCTVRVHIGTGLKEGKYYAQLMNASVADADARSHDMEQQTFTITVLSLNLGDANGDGNVTVADMTAIAHHVLGNTPEGFAEKAADANEDGQVNVADYTAVAHLLLYGSIERPASARVDNVGQAMDMSQLDNTVYIAPATAIAGREAVLSVRMKNAVEAEGFQFALTLPEGISVVRDEEGFAEACLSTERTTKEGTNTFATSLQPDGTLKVMAASTNGSAIKAGDGEVCTIRIKVDADMAEGDYTLQLSDVAISDTNAKSYDVEPLVATLTVHEASGISAALNDKGEMINEKCFDLHGRQLSNSKWLNSQMKKGVYIQDGRKYVK